ncbi:myrosinase 1-like [Thrips palmi]|uniref:Myrosinase 1-like n=1 Tax=Thrips palmi TaxID=161013 RepID=A0A6P8ZRZ0_THRPL|nr:myrosinase 1-like [Thrips palmi]
MALHMLFLLCVLPALGTAATVQTGNEDSRFALPEDLLLGAGVAAVQTEGAWNEGGKAESMVDFAIHSGRLGPMGFNHTNLHDRAADSYHRFQEDVKVAADLKLQLYRMSIAWSRIMPDANTSNPNIEAVAYYHSFIDEILKYNMIPVVTMYHFDHPQILEDEFNGWMDKRMVAKFEEYVKFLLKEYGSKVNLWTSVNEPNVYCSYWNTMIALARGRTMDSISDLNLYPCLHNFLLGHGVANKAFREGNYQGKIGFTVTTLLSVPASSAAEDVYASEAYNQMFAGMLLNPLVNGDYPQLVKNIVGDKLPKFSEDEKAMLKNSTDYIGLNVYYGMVVSYKDPATPRRPVDVPLRQLFKEANFMNVGYRSPTGESLDQFPSTMIAPEAMRSALLWTWFSYNVPIMITENGIGFPGVHDHLRAVYHSAFMRSMVSTIHEFGTKIIGYCAWSLIDSYEWSKGFSIPYGLVHVDYENGTLKRTLKDSSSFWLEMAERRVVPLVEPESSSSAGVHFTPAALALAVLASLFNAA